MQIVKNFRLLQVQGLFLILFICLIAGCKNGSEKNNYYLSFMGESESWKLKGYEVVITPETFKAGNGTLTMKGKDVYYTDYINMEVHAVINNEDKIVHSYSASGNAEMNIAEKTIGKIEGGTYINKNGTPVTLGNISEIYMVIQWRDKEQKRDIEERISLYQ